MTEEEIRESSAMFPEMWAASEATGCPITVSHKGQTLFYIWPDGRMKICEEEATPYEVASFLVDLGRDAAIFRLRASSDVADKVNEAL